MSLIKDINNNTHTVASKGRNSLDQSAFYSKASVSLSKINDTIDQDQSKNRISICYLSSNDGEKQQLELGKLKNIGRMSLRANLPSNKSSINSLKFVKKNSIQLPQINQKQIIILLIVMMLLIFICLLPYRVFSLWMATATKTQLNKLGVINYYNIITFCRVAFYTNSALNPIFYHIISTKFQTAFKKFFKLSYSSSISVANQPFRRINTMHSGRQMSKSLKIAEK